MSIWSIVSAIVPFVGLATLWAAVHYARKAAALTVERDTLERERLRLNITIAAMSDNYQEMDKLRKEAEVRANTIQREAARLAGQVAVNPDAEAAAREAALKLKEMLNGLS